MEWFRHRLVHWIGTRPIRRHLTHQLFRAWRLVEVRVGSCGGNCRDCAYISDRMVVMSMRTVCRAALHVQWEPEFTVEDARQWFGQTECEQHQQRDRSAISAEPWKPTPREPSPER